MGPDWKWGAQSGGGRGKTTRAVDSSGWVGVSWDAGGTNGYRWGSGGKYDLQIVDVNAPKKDPLRTSLPVGAKVVKNPEFWKWGSQGNDGVGKVIGAGTTANWVKVQWSNGDVNSYRNGAEDAWDLLPAPSAPVQAAGGGGGGAGGAGAAAVPAILPGSIVERGPSWKWLEQDGGTGSRGIVVPGGGLEGWVRVEWFKTPANNYRNGAEGGSRDLKLVADTTHAHVFPPPGSCKICVACANCTG